MICFQLLFIFYRLNSPNISIYVILNRLCTFILVLYLKSFPDLYSKNHLCTFNTDVQEIFLIVNLSVGLLFCKCLIKLHTPGQLRQELNQIILRFLILFLLLKRLMDMLTLFYYALVKPEYYKCLVFEAYQSI